MQEKETNKEESASDNVGMVATLGQPQDDESSGSSADDDDDSSSSSSSDDDNGGDLEGMALSLIRGAG